MSLIFHETTSFVSYAYAIKWSDPIDNGLYSRMLRVWPYLRISYITFNTILCFKILPMCVGSFFPLTKAKITLFRVASVTPSLYTMCPLKVDFHNIWIFPTKHYLILQWNNMLMAFRYNANGPIIHTHLQK